MPSDAVVTVSFSHPAAVLEHGEAVGLLGYRVVGVAEQPALPGPPSPDTPAGVADFLVWQSVLDRHDTWARALAAHADRVFNLGLGPVAAMLWPVLRPHLGQEPIVL